MGKVRRQCPQTTTFDEKGEPKRIRTEVPPLTSLTSYREAKPAHWRHSICALFFYQHILYHVLDYPGRTWLSVYKQRASETHIFHSFSWCLKRYFPPCWLALSLKHFFCFLRSNAFKSCWHSRFNRTSLLAIIAHFPASRHFPFVGSDYFGNSGMRSRGVSRSLSINTL